MIAPATRRRNRVSRIEWARQACCNFTGTGECLGVPVACDGGTPGPKDGRCPLADPGALCDFFETSVAPIASRRGVFVSSPGLQQRFCADCGEPVPARKRVCLTCRDTRRRQTFRKSQQRARQ